jgi:hypothetical protein
VRAPARAREIALRLAMGASRARLIRQIVTENLMIAVAGAGLGIAMGALLIQRIQDAFRFPNDLAVEFEFHMDQRALLFSLSASVVSVFLFGLIPAPQTVRANLATALKTTVGDAPRQPLLGRNLLVIVQVATALVLLTISVVNCTMFQKEFGGGSGYRTDHPLLMTFNPALADRSSEQTRQFYDKLLDRVRGVAGVESASLTTAVPMRVVGGDSVTFLPDDHQQEPLRTHVAARVDEDYFETMALPILQGRSFRKNDDPAAPRVAIVNQAFADRYWPGQDPIGKRFRRNTSDGPQRIA